MLRITTETKRGKTLITIEGRIAGQQVGTLEQCWRELYGNSPKAKYVINLCEVSFIDKGGKMLLQEMHRLGAELQAQGCLNEAIVEEIAKTGEEAAEKHVKKTKGAPIRQVPHPIRALGLLSRSRHRSAPWAPRSLQSPRQFLR